MKIRPFSTLSRFASLVLVVTLLAGCSTGGSEAEESPASTGSTSDATAAPGELSVARFSERITTAWAGVETLRVTSSSGPVPTGEPTPIAQRTATIEEWIAPDDRRITEIVDGTVTNEQVYVDGTIYMRGTFVVSAVAPEVGEETWIILDQDVVPADTPVGSRLAYLTRDSASPFASMSPDLLSLPVSESGRVRVGDRSCILYTFGDPGGEGDEIRYEVALDDTNLPCQVVQRGGGFQNSSVYEINTGDISITAPLEGTPVSGTPEG